MLSFSLGVVSCRQWFWGLTRRSHSSTKRQHLVFETRISTTQESRELGTVNQHDVIDREPPDLFNGHPPIEDPAHVTGFFETSSKEQ
jgi:hypothetical protein